MARAPHPAIFMPLILPFGVVVGYGQVATPYVLDKLGLLAVVVAASQQTGQLPHTIKIAWAPALDARGLRKHWFMGSLALAAVALAAAVLVNPKEQLGLYTALMFAANVGAATSSAAVDALMATTVPIERKGAAAGWSMAGNLGGTGVGGALGLWLSQHAQPIIAALVLAVVMLACGIPILRIDEEGRPTKPILPAIGGLVKDLWRTAISREGWTGLIICLSPVGAGAAANLFSGGMHNDYHVSEEHVEVVTGLLGGVVSAVGCLIGGYLADRMRRRVAYAAAGALMAAVAIAMAFGPLTPGAFTYGTLAYQFVNGIGYAAFAAFVLEMIGHEGAVTTKYTLFVAASNWAITYTAVLDGWGYDKAKVPGLFLTDAGATTVGIVIVVVMLLVTRKKKVEAVAATDASAA
ncbi:MAG TPA: MFS transporter [Polyangia bacterium]|jgi:predicted MFS family arabinose efflux permease|nr:MFS transporter [Polyangia bacterium]